jgi:hypothetical protein
MDDLSLLEEVAQGDRMWLADVSRELNSTKDKLTVR